MSPFSCSNSIKSDSFLGTSPVKLLRVQIQRNPAILAHSSWSWLNYTDQNLMRFTLPRLIYDNLDYAWSFSAELCREGLIGIAGSVLRYAFAVIGKNFVLSGSIFQVPKLGRKLKQDSIPLSYTPRKFITHSGNHFFYMIEGDHRVLGEVSAAEAKLQELVRYN
jgi:splicing factor 3B subunit 3